MSSDRLREAARVLRERAESAYREPWTPDGTGYIRIGEDDDGPCVYVNGGVYANQRRAAAYIATMHPGVGLALADWLDVTASTVVPTLAAYTRALRLADLILDGAA